MMRHLLRTSLIGLLLLAVAAVPAGAQELGDGSKAELEIIDADATGYPDVTFTVSVPVAISSEALGPDAFALTEEGESRTVRSVLVEEPIDVALLIDTSGSMAGEPLDVAKVAAAAFISRLPADARVSITGFGQNVDQVVGFTTDREAATDAISSLESGGETALYDALGAATRSFDREARRSVVVLSDGGDTVSKNTLESTREGILTSESSLYAIALETGESDSAGLQRLADGTDGVVVDSNNLDALFTSFGEVANRLTNQYVLSYESSASGSTKLLVSLAADGGVLTTRYDIEFGPAAAGTGGEIQVSRDGANALTGESVIVTEPGFVGSRTGLLVGALIVFAAIALAAGFALVPDRPRAHIGQMAASHIKGAPGALSDLQHRATTAADRVLENRSQDGWINRSLDRAGVDLRPGEFVVLAAAIAGGTAFFFLILGGPFFGFLGGGIALVSVRLWVTMKGDKRSRAFGDQLGDALMTMNGSLRSGHGVLQALDAVARESEAPMSEEMSRVVIETRIGRDVSEALEATAERMDNEDFEWVARAISIHRELGGDLAEILDNVAKTIRERARLRAQVRALTAEGRLSGVILLALPFVVILATRIINPEYVGELTGTSLGQIMLFVALSLMAVGAFWIRRLVQLKY
jgi:tight adherence protein B